MIVRPTERTYAELILTRECGEGIRTQTRGLRKGLRFWVDPCLAGVFALSACLGESNESRLNLQILLPFTRRPSLPLASGALGSRDTTGQPCGRPIPALDKKNVKCPHTRRQHTHPTTLTNPPKHALARGTLTFFPCPRQPQFEPFRGPPGTPFHVLAGGGTRGWFWLPVVGLLGWWGLTIHPKKTRKCDWLATCSFRSSAMFVSNIAARGGVFVFAEVLHSPTMYPLSDG